jgi:hypothetical protein
VSDNPPALAPRGLACAISLLAALALAACGEGVQELSYKADSKGKWLAIVDGPEKAEAGPAKITLDNYADVNADLQLIRVEGEHSRGEVTAAMSRIRNGRPFPKWFIPAGGVGTLIPGITMTVEQVLQPGTYYAFNATTGPTKLEALTTEVTGEESQEEIEEGEAKITASEYGYEVGAIPASEVAEVNFENVGSQPHHLIVSFLKGDETAADLKRSFETEENIKPEPSFLSAILEPGESQLVKLKMWPGRFAFYCVLSDREGGLPHVFKGMIEEVEVE